MAYFSQALKRMILRGFLDVGKENGARFGVISPEVTLPIIPSISDGRFGLLKQKLRLFNPINEFVLWKNTLKPHMNLNYDEC